MSGPPDRTQYTDIDLGGGRTVTGEHDAVRFVGTVDRPVRIEDATFVGPVLFDGVTFDAGVTVEDVEFGRDVTFENVEFGAAEYPSESGLAFRDVTVGGDLDLGSAEVRRPVELVRSTVEATADFADLVLTRPVRIRGTTFRDRVTFAGASVRNAGPEPFVPALRIHGSTFEADLDLSDATVGREAPDATAGGIECQDVAIEGELDCWNATFCAGPHGTAARFDAALRRADFEGTEFRSAADFAHTEFGEAARFNRARFRELAEFSGATFERAEFVGAAFGTAAFDDATFEGAAVFSNDLLAATFGGDATFRDAVFRGGARFERVEFAGAAEFPGVTFGTDADFSGATFRAGASPDEEGPRVVFRDAYFTVRPRFRGTTFEGDADFTDASFDEGATFGGGVTPTTFGGRATFRDVRFGNDATFEGVTFRDKTVFEDALFSGDADFSEVGFEGSPGAASASDRPTIELAGTVFSRAAFREACTFRTAAFEHRVTFEHAAFSEARFYRTVFESGGVFRNATVGERLRLLNMDPRTHLDFGKADLEHVDVTWIRHGEARTAAGPDCSIAFRDATLASAQLTIPDEQRCIYDFTGATLREDVVIGAERAGYDAASALEYCRFEKTRFEGFDFERYELSALDFEIHTTVDSAERYRLNPDVSARNETTYRLAKNAAKENGHDSAAGSFFQKEMRYRGWKHVGRLLRGGGRFKAGVRALINFAMRSLSGYGERPLYVVAWSLGVIGVFTVLYRSGLAALYGALYGVSTPRVGLLRSFTLSFQSFVGLIWRASLGDVPTVYRTATAVEGFLGAFLIGLFIYALTSSLR